MSLTVEERDILLAQLGVEQQEYLKFRMNRSRRTVFANVMATHKGAVVPSNSSYEEIEVLLEDWIYTGSIDAGKVTPELKCECGRSLRYQHIVEHKTTGQVLKFGIQHLEEHLGIDAKVVKDIRDGFQAIDYEMDEILEKYSRNWDNYRLLPPGYDKVKLPEDIQEHLALDLPLLNSQLMKIRTLVNAELIAARKDVPVARAKVETVPLFNPTQDVYDLFNVSNNDSELSSHAKVAIKAYLQSGIGSTRVLCEKLIQDKLISSDRFLTGKPKRYIEVYLYINELVTNGYCKLISSDAMDRKYEWNKC